MTWFSDDVFVLGAGLTEAVIGAMLISGWPPRLLIALMWVPPSRDPLPACTELLGHLPIFDTLCVLLVQGTRTPRAPSSPC